MERVSGEDRRHSVLASEMVMLWVSAERWGMGPWFLSYACLGQVSGEEISVLAHGSRLSGLNVEVVGGGREAAIIVFGIVVQVAVLISIFDS